MTTPKQYAEILDQLLEEVGEEDTEKAIGAFADLLKKSNDLRLADKIIEEYRNQGVKRVYVTSARQLSGEMKEELRKLGDIEKKIDKSLVGGVKIRIADTLIDGSIKSTLENLKAKLS